MNCRVCDLELVEPLFASGRKTSLTSMCTTEPQETVVFCCERCGHVQTPPLQHLAEYYDTEYNMSIDSAEEDQLYAMVDGVPVYRTEFQARTAIAKLDLPQGARVLDFGAAKGMTARHLVRMRPDVQAHVFDISDRYRTYWSEFVDESQMATYNVPDDWNASFDVVMSFYVLEHVDEPSSYMQQAAALLKPGGTMYLIVPNTFTNLSDFVVVDHVNHFTDPSLRYAFAQVGLDVQWVDSTTHTGAWIIAATRSDVTAPASDADVAGAVAQARNVADGWRDAYARIDAMSAVASVEQTAIYGASFFGSLIATNLDTLDNVHQFLDQNPHLQGKEVFGRPVTSPVGLDADVTNVLVGLDPLRAHAIIDSVEAFRGRELRFHFLGARP